MNKASSQTNPWLTVVVLCLGTFMILLDSTIVYMAVPSVMTGLHASFDQVLWVLNAYLLSFSVLLIVAGKLGDIIGPRKVFLAGLAIFTIASALCGLSQDGNQLIAARVLQGVGGALLSPQALIFITRLFAEDRRGAAFGVWSAVGSLGTVVGPTLGGLVVTGIDWRWIFFINVPIGLATFVAAIVFVPDLQLGGRHRFDVVGVLLSTGALFAITFGLIEGQRYDWVAVYAGVTIIEVITAGLVLFALFVAWEWRQAEPLVPLSLFRDRNFSVMNVVGIALSFGMQGVFLPMTIYLQSVLGLSALNAGLAIAPLTVVAMFTAPISGRLSDRFGGKYMLMAGLAIFAAGDYWLAQTVTSTSTWRDLLGPFLLGGAGLGLIFAPLPTIALQRVAPSMAGAASGVLNTTRQLGFAMAAGVIGAVLQSQLATALHDRAVASSVALPAALRPGFIDSFANAAKSGFALGRGQIGAAQLPSGLPPALKAQLLSLAHDVFVNGYVAALQPTIALAVGVLLVAALTTLLVSNRQQAADQPRELAADHTANPLAVSGG